ncbi:protein IRON-RELATED TRANSCRIPTION FACTOR 3-like isoform X2 [Malania oleifera]|uniref:protein IRON-RELATED TRANSCRIPTION FACTOR 3-like isoform X2 n=1 Tax=Malania oleifera TaxID=397392 RepID=UPI0025AE2B92|nr:protein IRON-RELATED TRANSCRIPTION FACTOR 3-like isoform X2 [Malania oleifera]XP_057968459.1 protein IRON-RELATED TRANSCRIPTION FACTOR 3-like isoform X2 [Malania oleifera]
MSTDLEAAVPSDDDVSVATEKRVSRSVCSPKTPRKVPKKIRKSEREKLKRDHLNVLFLELGQTLEQAHHNNGKACILTDATRLLRELLAQIDNLKNENAALLSEYHCVTVETDEVREENSTFKAEIKKLESELEERSRSKSAWNIDLSKSRDNSKPQLLTDHLMPVTEPATAIAPVFVVPLHHEHQDYPNSDTAGTTNLLSSVARPRARYASQMDSWPSEILSEPQNTTQ